MGVGYSLILIISLFITAGYPLVRGIDSAYTPTVIDASSIPIRAKIEDWSEALVWMKYNIPRDDVVVSWWDYGYWITEIGDKITLIDNATINGTQIAQVGKMFMSNETSALPILKKYDSKYIVVFTTLRLSSQGPILYGDEVKWRWMAQIGGLNDTLLEDQSITYQLALNWGEGDPNTISWLANLPLSKNDTVLTKLMVYGSLPEFEPLFGLKPNYFDLVFYSSNRLVLVYEILYPEV
jgi:dolichyl-diphosphooligosaccharide--protein glycosyltransferase